MREDLASCFYKNNNQVEKGLFCVQFGSVLFVHRFTCVHRLQPVSHKRLTRNSLDFVCLTAC